MSSWIGDGDEDAADTFETVGRRRQVLQALSTGSPSKIELIRTLSVSRSTVDRGVERLVGPGLVERSDSRFVATSADRVALGTHDEATRAMANVFGAVSILDHLPGSIELPPSLFRETVIRTGDLPEMERRAPFNSDINEVTELVGFNGPLLFSNWLETCEQFARLDDNVTLVLSAESLDRLSNRYPDDLDATVDAGVRMTTIDEDPTFGVVVVDRPTTASVTLAVYDHMSIPETLVASYEPPVVARGRRLAVARAETVRPYRPGE